ncbi:MAG TPA: hypothetical protein VEU62_23070 [Bryobacterales bacterium]|nr:hypothetical protein [Bryobacterales bacterium]
MSRRHTAVLLLASLAILPLLVSCSTGPPKPKYGSSEWYWDAAIERFEAGDLAKTQEDLEKVISSDSPFKARASTFYVVLLTGMALGNKDLSQVYGDGSTASKTQSGQFRSIGNDCVRLSRQFCMVLAQELEQFNKDAGSAAEFQLDFPFPLGSPNEDPAIGRIRKGMLPPEEERLPAERMAVKRGVLLETAAVVGAGDDTAKTAAMFQTRPVKVPRPVFMYGIAEGLLEESRIFDRKHTNEPEKRKIVLQLAADCLKPAQQGDDAELKKKAKTLEEKIVKEQKTLPKGV